MLTNYVVPWKQKNIFTSPVVNSLKGLALKPQSLGTFLKPIIAGPGILTLEN